MFVPLSFCGAMSSRPSILLVVSFPPHPTPPVLTSPGPVLSLQYGLPIGRAKLDTPQHLLDTGLACSSRHSLSYILGLDMFSSNYKYDIWVSLRDRTDAARNTSAFQWTLIDALTSLPIELTRFLPFVVQRKAKSCLEAQIHGVGAFG